MEAMLAEDTISSFFPTQQPATLAKALLFLRAISRHNFINQEHL